MTMTSKYERIKSECKKKNVLWEDPDFQAVQTSVFYYQTPPFTFQWKRISEIVAAPAFMSESENFDIIPGKMGRLNALSLFGFTFYQIHKFVNKRLCLNYICLYVDCNVFKIYILSKGDRWLVSCLGVLFSLKNLFYRVVPADQNIENSFGVFRFRLWWCGEWVEVSRQK